MLKSLSFKTKIVSTLILMSTGLILVSFILITQYKDQLNQAKGLSESSQVILNISSFIHELQKERARSVLLLNKKVPKTELEKQRTIVNEKISAMNDVIKNLNFDSLKNRAKNAESSLGQIREFETLNQKHLERSQI